MTLRGDPFFRNKSNNLIYNGVDMQYKIYARGKTVDYKWNSAPAIDFQEYLRENGILVEGTSTGEYSVYLVSENSASASDSQGRRMRIGVLVVGCSEKKAKGIAVWALENWNNFCPEFELLIKDFGADKWEANEPELGAFFESIKEINATGRIFEGRNKNANTEQCRNELIAEIKSFDFSKTAGFKLAVDGGIMTGDKLQKLKAQVQRYLAGEDGFKPLEVAPSANGRKQGRGFFKPPKHMLDKLRSLNVVCLLRAVCVLGIMCVWLGISVESLKFKFNKYNEKRNCEKQDIQEYLNPKFKYYDDELSKVWELVQKKIEENGEFNKKIKEYDDKIVAYETHVKELNVAIKDCNDKVAELESKVQGLDADSLKKEADKKEGQLE